MTKEKREYETMMAELRAIVSDIQNPITSLDDALKKYDRGQTLIAEITTYLKTVENTIKVHKLQHNEKDA